MKLKLTTVYFVLYYTFLFVFVIVIIKYMTCMLIQISPVSEIPQKTRKNYVYEIHEDGEDGESVVRRFTQFDSKIVDEIEELISLNPENWSSSTFIKDFKCRIVRIRDGHKFPPKTLIIIPENDVHWSDDTYFRSTDDDSVYFPEPNSILFHPTSFVTFQCKQKEINVIICE